MGLNLPFNERDDDGFPLGIVVIGPIKLKLAAVSELKYHIHRTQRIVIYNIRCQ